MISELKHSKKLSKRFRQDYNFRHVLFPSAKDYVYFEDGINEAEFFKENESFLSNDASIDSDTKFEKSICRAENHEELNRSILLATKYKLTKEQLTSKRLKKIKWRKKKFKLAPIRVLNPVLTIRFYEYNYPLDSSVFLNGSSNDQKKYSNFYDVSNFKRVGCTTYDKDRSSFITKLHEKVFYKENKYPYIMQHKYYVEWLKSLGNKKALQFVEVLEQIKMLRENTLKILLEYSGNNNSKVYLKQIPQNTLDWILGQPFISRTTKYEIVESSDESGLIEEEYNMELLKLMGFDENDTNEILSKLLRFLIQKSIYTKDYFSLTTVNLLQIESPKFTIDRDDIDRNVLFFLKDKNGNNPIQFKLTRFEEKWYESECLYKKSYLVLTL